MKRLRMALGVAFRESRPDLNPKRVLASRQTMGNEVQYQLRARVEWVHLSNERLSL
jgi:hypothetical protein